MVGRRTFGLGRLTRYLAAAVGLALVGPSVPALAAGAGARAPAPPPGHLVVVAVDRTSLADWERIPALAALARRGAVGLMNPNTASGDRLGAAALTIGASTHLVGPPFLRLAAGKGDLEVPAPLWRALGRAEAALPYPTDLGGLGAALRRRRLAVAAVGVRGSPSVTALALLADARGRIPGARLVADGAPAAVADRLAATAGAAAAHDAVTVVALPWTEALNSAWPELGAAPRRRAEAVAFAAVSRFFGRLEARLPAGVRLLVFSPLPSWPMVTTNQVLTPVLLAGPGVPRGELTSATTHRRGIVANLDVAPTVLGLFHLPLPGAMLGRPLTVQPGHGALARLTREAVAIAFVSRLRQPLLHVVVGFIVLVYLLGIALLFRRTALRRHLRVPLLTVLYLPLAMLLFGAFGILSEPLAFAVVFGLAAVPAALTARFVDDPALAAVPPALLVTFLLVADLLTGQHLIRTSPLGYDPQIGARYYGIGNEFMGVMVGASTVGGTALLDRLGRRAVPALLALFALCLVVLITPGLGTKVGGAITATAAYAFVWLGLSGRRLGLREALAVAATAVLLIALIVVFDLVAHAPGQRTDVGRTGLLIARGGLAAAAVIAGRKLGTDVALVEGSYWSILLGVALAAVVGFFTRSLGIAGRLAARRPGLAHGVTGALVGALVALLFNDTGVVAASTDIIFPVSAVLLFALAEGEAPVKPAPPARPTGAG